MKKLVLAASVFALAVTVAHADPIAEREALMKSFGQALSVLAPIAKGEKPFDATEAHAGLVTLHERAQKLDVAALFPEGSTSDESEASPKIWEDFEGFAAAADKFKADAAEASAEAPADLEAFQASFRTVSANCGACHQTFRIKKD